MSRSVTRYHTSLGFFVDIHRFVPKANDVLWVNADGPKARKHVGQFVVLSVRDDFLELQPKLGRKIEADKIDVWEAALGA